MRRAFELCGRKSSDSRGDGGFDEVDLIRPRDCGDDCVYATQSKFEVVCVVVIDDEDLEAARCKRWFFLNDR